MNRIRAPRFDLDGNVVATFWPKNYTHWNCRQNHLFLRKWRGNRRRFRLPYYHGKKLIAWDEIDKYQFSFEFSVGKG